MRVLVTRPEPAASRTAARLAALGHEALVAPLLIPRGLDWRLPPREWQAVAFTSALALQFAGPQLARLTALPAYVVGPATAAAARAAGFADVRVGAGSAARLFVAARYDGIARLLHLAGRDRTSARAPEGLLVTIVEAYAADLAEAFPAGGVDLSLIYSSRTAIHFARLCDRAGIDRAGRAVAVLSPAVAAALGPGWRSIAVASEPTEDALFAACGLTCEKPG